MLFKTISDKRRDAKMRYEAASLEAGDYISNASIDSVLVQCWTTGCDAGPALSPH